MRRVFISSTSKDLTDHRAAVQDAILKLGMHPVMMEHFPAMDADAVEACKQKVLDCDLFVGIYAHRYGYQPAGEGKSITEMEYEWAKAANLPRRVFVIQPDYQWPHEFTDMGDEATKLAAFKKHVGTGHVWSTFTTPDSLAAAVTQSLAHDAKQFSREESRQRQLLIGGILAVTLLLAGVIAAILLSDPNEEEIGISQADRAGTNQAIAEANQTATATLWTPTPTSTNTATPTSTPTPTHTPTLTATPREGEPAAEGEVIVVIAGFTRLDADATSIEPNLERALEEAEIRVVRVGHVIADNDEAEAVRELYNATLLIWGEVARGGVQVQFAAKTIELSASPLGFDNFNVSAGDVPSLDIYIFEGMGVEYVVEYTLGRIEFFEDNYASAVEHLTLAEAEIPAGREAEVKAEWLYLLRGQLQQELDEYEAARQDFEKAAEIRPDWGFPHLLVSLSYALQSNPAGALEHIDLAFELGIDLPGADEVYVRDFLITGYMLRSGSLVLLYALHGLEVDLELAKTDMDAAIELGLLQLVEDIDYPLASLYAQRAFALTALGDVPAALADYQMAIDLEPDYPDYYNLRGRVYADNRLFDSAVADFSHAITLDDTQAVYFRNRASVYVDLDRPQNALADLNRAIELAPEDSLNYSSRAVAYFYMGDYEAGIADYTQALAFVPEADTELRFALYRARAEGHLALEDYAGALEDYTLALEIEPDHADTLGDRGLMYMFLGEVAPALADFTRQIELDPDNFVPYFARASIYTGVPGYEDCELATADIEKFAELEPRADQLPGLRQDLARICTPPTPIPTPEAVTDPIFETGATIEITGPRPLVIFAEPNLLANQIGFCMAGSTAIAQQTVQSSDGRRWVEIDCDNQRSWVQETDLQ